MVFRTLQVPLAASTPLKKISAALNDALRLDSMVTVLLLLLRFTLTVILALSVTHTWATREWCKGA